MSRRPTIQDVAKKAGMSLSTVSLVINDCGRVSEETRKKVLRIVAELGYHATRTARGLASQTSGNIGFILTENHFSQAEPFYTRIFLGTEFEARNHNFYVLLTTVKERFSERETIPRFVLERNVDGIIVAGKINEKLIQYIESAGLPAVLVDFQLKRKRMSAILIDNHTGGVLATNHLLELGHRKIAFIGGDLGHPSIGERFRAYKETLSEHGIPFDASMASVREKDTRMDDGYRAAEKLLSRTPRVSAVFAANDAMAIGCLRYAKQKGLRIPEDLAIVGFDDIELASHVEPRLTTIRVPKEEMGKMAVQHLVEIIQSKTKAIVTAHVPVDLVVRESTGGHAGKYAPLTPDADEGFAA